MWQDLERRIRNIASNRWNCNATTETIAGVKCDCVLKPQPDEWIIVEITEESSLEKVRTDIAKLVTVKQSLFMNNVFARCYFVMKNTPTDSMRAAGDAQKIFVRSAEEFQNEYFQYSNYVYTRKKKQFGSLINIETGEPESNIYIDVSLKVILGLEKVDVSSRFLTFLHKMLSVVLILLRLICASTGVLKGH